MQQAVPPAWEAKSDWDIFKELAKKVSELAKVHLPEPVKDLVMKPLAHDTPDELAQPEILDWRKGEGEYTPGKTGPKLIVVERDYQKLYERMISVGRGVVRNGIKAHGLAIPAADIYTSKTWPGSNWEHRVINGT